MAGIIGQLTASARRRNDANKINSDKCMYHLPAFDQNGFNPLVHNSYARNRARLLAGMDINETISTTEEDTVWKWQEIHHFIESYICLGCWDWSQVGCQQPSLWTKYLCCCHILFSYWIPSFLCILSLFSCENVIFDVNFYFNCLSSPVFSRLIK